MTTLKTNIIDSYDEFMSPYLGSPEVKYETSELNKRYWALRAKIDPEVHQEFDEFFTANEQMWQAETEEALYIGVMAGIAERDNLFK